MLKDKNILLCVTGGIAAYKTASLASALVKAGNNVYVLMSKNATNFINPITFESLTSHKCIVDTFDRNFEFNIEHISLAKKADIAVIAPATANIIGKLANGIADDMISTTLLAATCPILVAPAMNMNMYNNKIVKDNINKLKSYGFHIIEPLSGYLACGDIGTGKMPEWDEILDNINLHIAYKKDLSGKKVLVSAGATMEAIDPVRYITNHSTGKMGMEIARAAAYRGADVDLVLGNSNEKRPRFVNIIDVKSAKEMFEAIKNIADAEDIIIKAAAVADYRPVNVSDNKIKKSESDLSIDLERTDDILKYLGENKKAGQFICGFSMETENLIENSKNKLLKKSIDMIVANDLRTEGAGFGVDTNVASIITKNSIKECALMTKTELAHIILDEILRNNNM